MNNHDIGIIMGTVLMTRCFYGYEFNWVDQSLFFLGIGLLFI